MDETRRSEGSNGPPTEPSQSALERREAKRYPAGGIGFRSSQIDASLIDLSSDGLAIESLESPPIGGTLSFALEQGRARVDADAEVCWCRLRRTYRTAVGDVVAVYRAGLRLGPDRPKTFESLARAARLSWAVSNA